MRWTRTLIPTLKEDPAEVEAASHRLMMRAGMIRRLGAGVYTYLPLVFRALNKAIGIVRQEMDRAGAVEILMPVLQPAELWEKTGRLAVWADILMNFRDHQNRHLVLGPTHEEVVTDLVAHEVRSYKQLPITLYQIQTKFRDELRPRFGVLRTREFVMKDAYSFDADLDGLNRSYQAMYDAYCRIFDRCGLKPLAVEADSGAMGGDVSAEFMVPCSAGEDRLATCPKCGYAANIECAQPAPVPPSDEPQLDRREVATPGASTIEQVSKFLNVERRKLVKTIIYVADGEPVAAMVRGDHEVNESKLARLLGKPVQTADPDTITRATGAPVGFAGPVGLKARIIVDQAVLGVHNFVTGANKADTHLLNVNLGRDFTGEVADIRFAVEGDACPRCGAQLDLVQGIEIGHVFKLGTKYTRQLGATYLDENGREHPCIMGGYGIGVNRIIAAAIEMSHDDKGIIWPTGIAPYTAEVVPLNMDVPEIVQFAEHIHDELERAGIDTLLDDRDGSAGVKFNDADLIGLPLRIVVGKKAFDKGGVEIKLRREPKPQFVPRDGVLAAATEKLAAASRVAS